MKKNELCQGTVIKVAFFSNNDNVPYYKEVFMLSIVASNKMKLISLKNGNYWNEKTMNLSNTKRHVTLKELEKLLVRNEDKEQVEIEVVGNISEICNAFFFSLR